MAYVYPSERATVVSEGLGGRHGTTAELTSRPNPFRPDAQQTNHLYDGVSGESVLLAEKDEIIKAVMAEGEELSKKQAVQEGNIKKLRAKLKEAEVEAQRLLSRLQVEEARVLSIQEVRAPSVQRCKSRESER